MKNIPGHDTVRPHATYAPWTEDNTFLEIYSQIKSHTMVDLYRCYELWTLVPQTRWLKGGLLEVGVWRGGTGALIAESARRCGIADPVYLCDTFKGVVKASPRDSFYVGGEHADTSCALVEGLLERQRLTNVRILEGIFPDETAQHIPDQRFRFCHIDVDVYASAKDILEWVWDKLDKGGIVVFDDYGAYGADGITKLVDEQRNQPDRVTLHNLNGHAVVVKVR